MPNEINEGDTVTAWNRERHGREAAKVLNIYDGQFNGQAVQKAEVEFKNGHKQEGMLLGLLRPIPRKGAKV